MADYIRRDIVLEIINTVNDTGGFAGYADYCVLFDEIDTMPASDVQPVKHGKWLKVSWNNYKCSLCDTQYAGMGAITFTYCPNCGAKMDIVYQDDKIRAIKVM